MDKVINLKDQKENDGLPDLPYVWKAHEYIRQEKSKQWFMATGVIGGTISLFSLIFGNVMFAFLTVLVVGLLFIYEVRGPKEYEFAITDKGVKIGERLFDFPNLKSFWIFEHETGENELSIESRKQFLPHLKIPLGDTEPDIARRLLKKFIPETHQEEALTEILARRFGI